MSEKNRQPEEEQEVQETSETTAQDSGSDLNAKESGDTRESGETTENNPEESGQEQTQVYTFTREQVEKMELAAKQLESVKDQFVRLTAEYDNYRKRTAKERERIYQDAKIDIIKEFLTVYDNLERAVSTEGGEDSPHKKGLELIFHQYREILKKIGVTEIEALGQPFDPDRHNAVMHIEDPDLGENIVSQVLQAGFLLGDKVLRFAIVQVAN